MKQKEHEHEIGDVRIRYEFGRAQNSGDAETLKGEQFCLKTMKTGSITGTACFEHGVLWVWHTNHYSEAPLRLRSCSKIETIVSVVFGQKRSARESGLVQDCQSKIGDEE